MSRLNFQDAAFLRMETPQFPFHIAALLILKPPPRAPRNYLGKLVQTYGQLHKSWPLLTRKLKDPDSPLTTSWIDEDDFRPERHILHYALPVGGGMEELLELVSRAHERLLDRNRPLWETHIIEGLPRGRFALYCKMHHALIDGTGGIRLILQSLLSGSPDDDLGSAAATTGNRDPESHHSPLEQISEVTRSIVKQYRAVPEVYSLLSHIGIDALRGKEDAIRLPFTAPQTLFNRQIDSSRRIILCALPLNRVRAMAHREGGSINDVSLAIFGGALRRYLLDHDALPRKSLIAGVPVAVKSADGQAGNHVSFIYCPYFTNEADPLVRLRRIIKVTRDAKVQLGEMSATASQDYGNLMITPMMLLAMSGTATRFRPMMNAVFSNVVGSPEKRYLQGSELEALYPLSVVMDGMAFNLTVVSYYTRLCFAITTCPAGQPGIECFGALLRESFEELCRAEKNSR